MKISWATLTSVVVVVVVAARKATAPLQAALVHRVVVVEPKEKIHGKDKKDPVEQGEGTEGALEQHDVVK